ncbi:MAG: AAA family ATPase, partial [Clostridia bacterium]|nr:AAA family ATPase [Clostridia bacterium]
MNIPLAERMRPTRLDDVVGQTHIIGEGKILTNILKSGKIPNMIFFGPAGCGKTTVANICANAANRVFFKLNATTASLKDVREIAEKTSEYENGILLYLDEIQNFNKKQQQSLLEYIENGKITLIASTTENPHFYIYNAILSRSTVLEFKNISPDEIEKAVRRAINGVKSDYPDRLITFS